MRESKIESYDPGYRSILYPWMQIIGIIVSIALIAYLGWTAILFTIGMISICVMWFLYYAKGKVSSDSALLILMQRLGSKAEKRTERELRENMQKLDVSQALSVNRSIQKSAVVDLSDDDSTFDIAVLRASVTLSSVANISQLELVEGFEKSRQIGSIPVWHRVAIPHINLYSIDETHIALVRSKKGIEVENIDVHGDSLPENRVHAFVFVVSPEDDPKKHLRALARIAAQVDQDGFIEKWLKAKTDEDFRELVYLT